jgi:signal transduction histidine kinase
MMSEQESEPRTCPSPAAPPRGDQSGPARGGATAARGPGTQAPMIQRRAGINLLVLLVPAALLLAAFLVNLLVVPLEWRLPVLYVIPMLVAAHRTSPRITAAFAVAGILLDLGEIALRQAPVALEARQLPILALVAYLSYLLAVRIQQAQRAQRNLQSFLGMAAHDLRGPIGIVLDYAKTALRPGTSPEDCARGHPSDGRHIRPGNWHQAGGSVPALPALLAPPHSAGHARDRAGALHQPGHSASPRRSHLGWEPGPRRRLHLHPHRTPAALDARGAASASGFCCWSSRPSAC